MTAESTKYTAPVSIAVSTVLKAIAVREDMTDSPVAEAEYTITYKVEVFAGEGMTRVADSGEDEQAEVRAPRRRELLAMAGLDFTTEVSPVPEIV